MKCVRVQEKKKGGGKRAEKKNKRKSMEEIEKYRWNDSKGWLRYS